MLYGFLDSSRIFYQRWLGTSLKELLYWLVCGCGRHVLVWFCARQARECMGGGGPLSMLISHVPLYKNSLILLIDAWVRTGFWQSLLPSSSIVSQISHYESHPPIEWPEDAEAGWEPLTPCLAIHLRKEKQQDGNAPKKKQIKIKEAKLSGRSGPKVGVRKCSIRKAVNAFQLAILPKSFPGQIFTCKEQEIIENLIVGIECQSCV